MTGPESTLEAWCVEYLRSTELQHKTAPPRRPDRFDEVRQVLRIDRPGRPPQLQVVTKSPRSLRRRELAHPERRARLLHTFWHHELQAAELMAWAVLAFPETSEEFRRGLLEVLDDELRHMRMYAARIRELGHELGGFPVRDWFWERVPTCADQVEFVALMGLGLEGGNLDHAERFGAWFREVGDEASARIQEVVGREEIAHVRFAARWFREWTGSLDFESWRARLVEPLTPRMFRGRPLARGSRRAAGFDDAFCDALEAAD